MKRFWNKVHKTNSCWIWTGATRSGYGALKIAGKVVSAHRYSFELANGKIPDGLIVLHSCDNPLCVNPSHLSTGSYKDNTLDAINKGRHRIPAGERFKNGHLPCNADIKSDTEIDKLKFALQNRGDKSIRDLATDLHVKYQMLRDINCGKTYREKVAAKFKINA